jgi:hypothetical protein
MAPRGGDCDKADGQVVVMCWWPAGRKSGIEMLCEPLRHTRQNESGLDRRVAADLQLAGSAQYALPVAGQTGHEAAVTRSGVTRERGHRTPHPLATARLAL